MKQEKIEKQKKEEAERLYKLKVENTKISAIFSNTGSVTVDKFIDIDFKLENIGELLINDKEIEIKGNNFKYKFNLELGENNIKIIGKNDDIIKEVNYNIKRVSEEEFKKLEKEKKDKIEAERIKLEKEKKEKIEKERLEKIEKEKLEKEKKEKERLDKIEADKKELEAKRLGLSYNDVIYDISYLTMKRSTDVNGEPRYMGFDKDGGVMIEIIGDKKNITQTTIAMSKSDIATASIFNLYLKNILPSEYALDVMNDLNDGLVENNGMYFRVYGDKELFYQKNSLGLLMLTVKKVK